MAHALIITDCDPLDASFDRRARLSQAVRLYTEAGFQFDVIFLARRGFDLDCHDRSALVIEGFRQLGILPADLRHHHGDDVNPDLFDLITGLRGRRAPYDAVHLDQVLVRPDERLGLSWLVDSYDQPFDGGWDHRKFDVLFAAYDDLRSANAGYAHQSVRLPLGIADDPLPHSGGMIGWVGRINGAVAERWSEMLELLAQRGARLQRGVLLAGQGANAIQVPSVLSSVVVKMDTPSPGAERALALAVLPSSNAEGWLARLTSLIAAECPVLTVPEIAGKFQDRWHLPTFEDANGFADAIEAWCEAHGRDAVLAATRTSAEAFSYDRVAMHTYVKDSLPVLEKSGVTV